MSTAVVGVVGVALCTILGDGAVVVVPEAKAVGMVLCGVYFQVGLVELGPVGIWYQGIGHAALGKVVSWDASAGMRRCSGRRPASPAFDHESSRLWLSTVVSRMLTWLVYA